MTTVIQTQTSQQFIWKKKKNSFFFCVYCWPSIDSVIIHYSFILMVFLLVNLIQTKGIEYALNETIFSFSLSSSHIASKWESKRNHFERKIEKKRSLINAASRFYQLEIAFLWLKKPELKRNTNSLYVISHFSFCDEPIFMVCASRQRPETSIHFCYSSHWTYALFFLLRSLTRSGI